MLNGLGFLTNTSFSYFNSGHGKDQNAIHSQLGTWIEQRFEALELGAGDLN